MRNYVHCNFIALLQRIMSSLVCASGTTGIDLQSATSASVQNDPSNTNTKDYVIEYSLPVHLFILLGFNIFFLPRSHSIISLQPTASSFSALIPLWPGSFHWFMFDRMLSEGRGLRFYCPVNKAFWDLIPLGFQRTR